MPRRSEQQWLTMVARTRPEAAAVAALRREFDANAGADDLDASARDRVRDAVEQLARRVPAPAPRDAAGRAVMLVEYRPDALGGRGRLHLELEGRTPLEPRGPATLEAHGVYVLDDERGFCAVQVDGATALLEHAGSVTRELDALALPRVNCPEANLEGASVAAVLAWALEHRVRAGR